MDKVAKKTSNTRVGKPNNTKGSKSLSKSLSKEIDLNWIKLNIISLTRKVELEERYSV